MSNDNLVIQAKNFGHSRGILIDFGNPLGIGQEGIVWKTNRETAVKVFDRIGYFDRDVACYLKLKESDVYEIAGFTVPRLIDFDSEFHVVEMSIVAPPYLLDFGKSWMSRPNYTAEQWEEYEDEKSSLFDGNWELVQSALYALKKYGIWYIDPNPNNINCEKHPLAVKAK
ncbi:MAG: hypothetical protein ACK578_28545 [Pirellula sp.]